MIIELKGINKNKLVKDYLKTKGEMLYTRSMNIYTLMELHKGLVEISNAKHNYGDDMIEKLMRCSKSENKVFLQSEYVATYIKKAIKEIMNEKDFNEAAITAINSFRYFSEMNSYELLSIHLGIKKYYSEKTKVSNVYSIPDGKNKEIVTKPNYNISILFEEFLLNLPSEGVRDLFIASPYYRTQFTKHLLLYNGLNDDASFYAGLGVRESDINTDKLMGIFCDLLMFSEHWATEFLEFVKDMETLGASEFITAFYEFALCGFNATDRRNYNNYSLRGSEARDKGLQNKAKSIAIMALGMSRIEDDKEYQKYQLHETERIKSNFFEVAREFIHDNRLDIPVTYEFPEMHGTYK